MSSRTSMHFRVTSNLLCAVVFLTGAINTVAGTFHVSPTRLDVGGIAKTGVLTIRNDSPEETVVIQTKPMKWWQLDGRDVTAPTTDLIVNPPIFTLKPGSQQIIRIGARDPQLTDGNAIELTYRLVLSEVPRTPSPDFRGVNVLLNMSVPIFFAPKSIAIVETPPLVNASRDVEGKITANVSNPGDRSVKITRVNIVERSSTKIVAEIDQFRYVLAGSAVSWTFKPLPVADYAVSLTSDRAIYNVDLDLTAAIAQPAKAAAPNDAAVSTVGASTSPSR